MLHQKVAGMQADPTTPNTRLADNPLPFNPATVDALVIGDVVMLRQ